MKKEHLLKVTTSNTRNPIIRIYENIQDEKAGYLEVELTLEQAVRVSADLLSSVDRKMCKAN